MGFECIEGRNKLLSAVFRGVVVEQFGVILWTVPSPSWSLLECTQFPLLPCRLSRDCIAGAVIAEERFDDSFSVEMMTMWTKSASNYKYEPQIFKNTCCNSESSQVGGDLCLVFGRDHMCGKAALHLEP